MLLGALLCAGWAARLHGLGRSLWLDEAWVANSVLQPSFRDTLYYDAWLQTSPPLFLLLVRVASDLFGDSNAALRLVPAAFGAASLALFAWLAVRWLRPPGALCALLLFACSPTLALYTASLKQYASDVFVATLMLALGGALLERPGRGRLAASLAAAGVASLLSFQALLLLPAWLGVAAPAPGRPRAHWGRAAAIATLGVGLAGLEALLFVWPNRETSLTDYFRSGFFQGGSLLDLAGYCGERLRILAGPLFAVERGSAGEVAALALAALGIGDLARRGAADARAFGRALLLATPVLGALALNLLGQLPMSPGDARVLLFLFPITTLALGAGIEAASRAAGEVVARLAPADRPPPIDAGAWLALVGLLGVLVARLASGELAGLLRRPPSEDAQAAVAELASAAQPGDVVYVHSSMREAFALYARRFPPRATDLVLGEVDRPCCPRGAPLERDVPPPVAMPRELHRIAAAHPGRLFVLVTDREAHFRLRGWRSPTVFERFLPSIGCALRETMRFPGVRLDRYACDDRGRPG